VLSLKIIFIVHNLFFPGGTNKAIINLANGLAEAGHKVAITSVIARKQSFLFELHSAIELDTIVPYDLKHPKGIIINRLRKYTPLFKPVIMSEQETGYDQYNRYIEYKIKEYVSLQSNCYIIGTRPIINMLIADSEAPAVHKIGMEHAILNSHAPTIQKKMKNYYHQLDVLTTLTEQDLIDYKKLLPELTVDVLPNIVTVNAKPKTKRNVIVAAGRFEYEKGFDLLIEAVHLSHDIITAHQYKVELYGSGSEREKLESLIKQYHLQKLITILPPHEHLDEIIASSAITCVPSRFEGFGMVIFEAMLLRSLVITFDCPNGPKELLTDQLNALKAEEQNIQSLSNKINSAITSNNDLIIEQGYVKAQSYNCASIINRFLKILPL